MSAAPSAHASIQRVFLGWDRPALLESARRLEARYRQGRTLDLGRVLVVVPGQRAGRRLQEWLAFLAEDEKLLLTPPEVVTEGRLPELLYTPKLPFANELVQDLAWAQALRELPTPSRQHVVPHPPPTTDTLRWLELGRVLRRLHVELAADGLNFATVHQKGKELIGFNETERWQALATVQQHYLNLLDKQQLWDIQTARLVAIQWSEIGTERDIILLGMVDLHTILRRMLKQVAERITVYLVAPEDLADHFDDYGCLIPHKWCEMQAPLDDEQLQQVDGSSEQADAVSEWLVELAGRYQVDEVVIGAPDQSLVPQLQRQLEQCGVRTRWVEGMRLADTAPYRLLAAAVQFASRRRYDDLAALIRHTDLEDWLRRAISQHIHFLDKDGTATLSLPAQLDRFYNRHLPSRILAGQSFRHVEDCPDLAPAFDRVEAWLHEASMNHPLRAWGDAFRKILGAIYGDRTLHLDVAADEVLHGTLCRILNECDRLSTLPEALDTMSLTAADAFQVALRPLADEALSPPADPDAVAILGWLELPLDDARALIVTSFNEGVVPQSSGADAFLPDRLRRELGLLHNERRYARDTYATCVLCKSGKELHVLFARRDIDNNPCQPSRLVFACSDETLIRRGQQFFAGVRAPVAPHRLLLSSSSMILDKSLFEVPRPVSLAERRRRIAVTEFKDYLACPYRYYLRHVRKLRVVDDTARELDGRAFGTLLHKVLSALGKDTAGPRHSDRKQDIFDFLVSQLSALATKMYGPNQHRPAIRLQLEQARRRLSAFASRHVELIQNGWRIIYTEDDGEDGLSVDFPVDGEPITLIGRIDRIDFHEVERKVRILDFKVADHAKEPEQAHRYRGEQWIDLQLPLYRHLWRSATVVPENCTVELGYFNLPKAEDKTAVAIASWDVRLLAEADEVAKVVIRNLRREIFEPPTYPAPEFSDDLAVICLDHVFGQPVFGDDDQGDAG